MIKRYAIYSENTSKVVRRDTCTIGLPQGNDSKKRPTRDCGQEFFLNVAYIGGMTVLFLKWEKVCKV